jgi:hypothetical protein
MKSTVCRLALAGSAVLALLGTGIGSAAATPAAHGAAPRAIPATAPGATLTGATATFATLDDDKDDDTQLSIQVQNPAGSPVAAAAGTFGLFPDHRTTGPFNLPVLVPVTAGALDNGLIRIAIAPNGNDTWKFNYEIDLFFSDGTTIPITGVNQVLSESSPVLTRRFNTGVPVTVPNIIFARPLRAATILRAAGLVPGNQSQTPTIDCAAVGLVVEQNPGAGSQVPAGSSVDFSVGVLARGHSCS